MEFKRSFLAIILIGLVMFLTPMYYKLVAPETMQSPIVESDFPPDTSQYNDARDTTYYSEPPPESEPEPPVVEFNNEITFTVETNLYRAVMTNRSGGSISEFHLYDYVDSFDADGKYHLDSPVFLIQDDHDACKPCLALFDRDEKEYSYLNMTFSTDILDGSLFQLSDGDSLTITMQSPALPQGILTKQMTFHGDSYKTSHHFNLTSLEELFRQSLEVTWIGGLLPTEYVEVEDTRNSAAMVYQSGSLDDINLTKDNTINRKQYDGSTDWVALKNKYFLAAILPETKGIYGSLSAYNIHFSDRKVTPIFNVGIGFDSNLREINTQLYLGPQDFKTLHETADNLEDAMNWGIKIIRPISKYIILSTLMFLRNPFGDFYLNYGIVLIIFAVLVRLITGPLTRRSFKSTKKMQMIQPKTKELQKKYSKDPARMNKEVMALYKKEGVNPLGGCLPMLIQMPLLFALFIVFRNTIEFRGAEFFLWITDLSKPDVVYTLPFSIPLYGNGVAILPIFMGLTMFFQQRMSMATMDKSQRPMMYMMTAFFFLIFNQFPAGLNLYYAMMNLLNIVQQRSINKTLNGST